MELTGPDLTRKPPRSLRVRLGGYVILPRTLDKARATIAGKNGSYKFHCPLDRRFFEFTGISPNSLLNQLASGKNDEQMLAWVRRSGSRNRSLWEIDAWARFESERGPSGLEELRTFAQILERIAPSREDVSTWFDLIDLDDYASFGGRAA